MTIAKCTECHGDAEMRLGAGGQQLAFCIACAKKMAKELGLPSVLAAAEDAERRKQGL